MPARPTTPTARVTKSRARCSMWGLGSWSMHPTIDTALHRAANRGQRFGQDRADLPIPDHTMAAMQHRLLLAEDDAGIADPLERALAREGYAVDVVADGALAVARGIEGDHDLLVLDVGLPSLDGLEVCRRVRAARPRVPVLILTARDEELDAVQGLDAGADDYVTKPFRLAELLARIRALLRRV